VKSLPDIDLETIRERWPRRVITLVTLACLGLAVMPFIWVSPSDVRGIPGPLLVVIALVASFLLGPYLGVALMIIAVFLGVAVVGENQVSEPLIWIPAALLTGLFGERVRRNDELRWAVLDEMRLGLTALTDLSRVGGLRVAARYEPAEQAQVLAADFYGVLVTPTGDLATMVGDVSGHGPRAAAVATHLRAAWRALVSAGEPELVIVEILDETLRAEQQRHPGHGDITFASLCLVTVAADYQSAVVCAAGHPPPMLVEPGRAQLCEVQHGPLLGWGGPGAWATSLIALPEGAWTLVSYTDGLVEGRGADGKRPLGADAVLAELVRFGPVIGRDGLDLVMDYVSGVNGGPMLDDVVVVSVSHPEAEPAREGERRPVGTSTTEEP
jgi:hypothetical protein